MSTVQDPLITDSRHPMYTLADYEKFRLTYKGGREFILRYLKQFDSREDGRDFLRRQEITHNPGFAAQALDEIVAGITQRMPEIIRTGVTDSYTRAVQGFDGGVDLENSTMDSFIAAKVLPNLMTMGRVGVYVDMPKFNPVSTLADFQVVPHPYLYSYDAFDILNWYFCYDPARNEILLRSLLLRERYWTFNKAGLPDQAKDRFRLCVLTHEGVKVSFYEQYMPERGIVSEKVTEEYLLPLTRIPFVMLDLGKSLLTDAADIQIGLLNLASADLNYAINANFPFYVEGYDPKTENLHGKTGPQTTFDVDGNPTEKTTASGDTAPEIVVGAMHGRRYPFEAPPPQFIHPSPEPLRVSMDKQEAMKLDIRRLLNLNVSNVQASRASAESKKVDQSAGLESGLAFIGLEVEGAERELALIWAEYEGEEISKKISVSYPTTYSLKTDEDRIAEAKSLQEVQGVAPSVTFQKEVSKLAVKAVLDGKVNSETLKKINSEIESAKYITGDVEAVSKDFEMGIVDSKTAAQARGYDPALVKVAQDERTQRMKDIAMAQTTGSGAAQDAARGGDGAPNATAEKTNSQNPDNNPDGGKPVRGAGK